MSSSGTTTHLPKDHITVDVLRDGEGVGGLVEHRLHVVNVRDGDGDVGLRHLVSSIAQPNQHRKLNTEKRVLFSYATISNEYEGLKIYIFHP